MSLLRFVPAWRGLAPRLLGVVGLLAIVAAVLFAMGGFPAEIREALGR